MYFPDYYTDRQTTKRKLAEQRRLEYAAAEARYQRSARRWTWAAWIAGAVAASVVIVAVFIYATSRPDTSSASIPSPAPMETLRVVYRPSRMAWEGDSPWTCPISHVHHYEPDGTHCWGSAR